MKYESKTSRRIAFFPEQGSTGEESGEGIALDLNRYVVRNPAATFMMKVEGSAFDHANIYEGDIIVVDRSVQPSENSFVVGIVDGELCLKAFSLVRSSQDDQPVQVWGVVTYVIHKV